MMADTATISAQINLIKPGLALALSGLLFGISLGVAFGLFEESFKEVIAQGIAAHPQLHDAESPGKIWRYVQRTHFHAMGIAAFSLPLLIMVVISNLQPQFKKLSSVLIGLSALYPLAWFTMYLKAPELGRDAAHEHLITELFVYIGIGGLLVGIAILVANLFFGLFSHQKQ